MAKSFNSVSLLRVISVNAVLNTLMNQIQRSWSSWLLTGGIGGMLFAFPLTQSTVCSIINLTQSSILGPFMYDRARKILQ